MQCGEGVTKEGKKNVFPFISWVGAKRVRETTKEGGETAKKNEIYILNYHGCRNVGKKITKAPSNEYKVKCMEV